MSQLTETETLRLELKLLKELIGLSKLSANWNQFGAEPLNASILNDAVRFVEDYVTELQELPTVVPMTRGRLQFEWSGDGRALELEFEEPGRLHYLLCRGADEIEEIIDSSDRESILTLLRSYFSLGE